MTFGSFLAGWLVEMVRLYQRVMKASFGQHRRLMTLKGITFYSMTMVL